MDVPALLRAARRLRRLSQRQLAELAGVPRSTVDRIEAGASDPRISTLEALLGAIGIELAAHVGGQLLTIDQEREQLVDFAGRHLPPHWEVEAVIPRDGWWGWWRKQPRIRAFPPSHTYWRRWNRQGTADAEALAYLWQDAT
ncbi:MAG TPA: helix-turn-helix transcriptional regulator [Jatrophihabitans sp.]|nr:helix-turn-helix transcriptional regulator [Jatrophihabitans sp.]